MPPQLSSLHSRDPSLSLFASLPFNFLYCMFVTVTDNDKNKNGNVGFCGKWLHVKSELEI